MSIFFIGLVSGTAQAAQGISLLVFPLTFVSSGYVIFLWAAAISAVFAAPSIARYRRG